MNIKENYFFKLIFLLPLLCGTAANSQNIGDFVALAPTKQSKTFDIPPTHNFQKIIEQGDALTEGGTFPKQTDFTGYVPISGSSTNGYLSINSETDRPGLGVTILDINYNATSKLWEKTLSKSVDFGKAGTHRNCSGTVTSWGTVISCEEAIDTTDRNGDGRNDRGWCVEIDPVTKTVIDRRWALGNMKHENIVVHENERTVYEGADDKIGYLHKFVADNPQDLSSGKLYVYKGSKSGAGDWILLKNETPAEQNTTVSQSTAVGATVFNGIEDVEIGPDGYVYFAVKAENRVYRFQDSDAITGITVPKMETFVGDRNYNITHATGTTSVRWGYGPDNLAFDGQGNLWVLQDGDDNYIWVVEKGHTQASPKVKIFGRTPKDSEPTGITFSPDYKYLFMSIQHPFKENNASQKDAAGNIINFNTDTTLVIALAGDLAEGNLSVGDVDLDTLTSFYPNPSTGKFNINLEKAYSDVEIFVSNINGKLVQNKKLKATDKITIDLSNEASGTYFIKVKSGNTIIDTVKAVKE